MSSPEQSQAPPATATQNPPATNSSASQTPPTDAQNGANAKSKAPNQNQNQKQKQPQKPKATDATAADGSGEKLSPAEMKKKQKAEKAARRAREKLEREGGAAAGAGAAGGAQQGAQQGAVQGGPVQTPRRPQQGGRDGLASTPRGPRFAGGARGTPLPTPTETKKKEDKNVAVFGHLYGIPRRSTIAGAAKEVHPAVLALGLQIRDYVICGSSARCVATLIAFKRVIESYTTPIGTSLARHLTTHLSHQITYLSTCRPLSISQGNAIRALKLSISSIDPSVPEATAKTELCEFINNFIREKITVADQVIATSATQKIQDGDVIVTFAGSSIVKQTLITAHKQGKKFRVSVIDSRPLFEGKNLARALSSAGLDVQYSLIHGISHAMKDATKVFLGAHAMTGNGRLYSRVGTALVAMSAKERSGGAEIPVIVCCETVKFTDRVALDSIVVNEIADADELITKQPLSQVTGRPDPHKTVDEKPGKKGNNQNVTDGIASLTLDQNAPSPLTGWKDTPNLQLLNIMHDVTPAEYVDMVVTEMGSLPPSAVPIVHRMSTNS
ncbi:translation initiation factor eif-2b delta subunit [Talaromyces stipitatus ATCC 10500]|uniref:Translation initiation factor eIF2B subunit delta n=1 Tax=Talaromyces stipitatus (strain ATCC 10500 / CBS 375.48 / QM 6759 / NRRL 1006) TaxID=441959 RepID=B8LYH8_TALSN|nr:translation initiation factor eif-2b delta subunit [Talaromyces stipitatus ATCC 10500]EED22907.1 translation initiation factor eif-2b delta subunit [Talaromyces stipitatus ATCC 10500]